MPFKNYPQVSIRDWRPDYDDFDVEVDRLLVSTDWGEKIILAWSTGERWAGGLVLAPEAVPDNIASYYQGKLGLFEYKPGKFVQPQLFVTQMNDNRLQLELAHPAFDGLFQTSGHPTRIQQVKRGRRKHSIEVAGYKLGITERQ